MSEIATEKETPAEKLARKAEVAEKRPAPAAKKPQDRKVKLTTKKLDGGLVQVTRGKLKVTLDPSAANDWRYISAASALQGGTGDEVDLNTMVAMLIPSRADQRAMEAEVLKDGRVDAQDFFELYRELVEAAGLGES